MERLARGTSGWAGLLCALIGIGLSPIRGQAQETATVMAATEEPKAIAAAAPDDTTAGTPTAHDRLAPAAQPDEEAAMAVVLPRVLSDADIARYRRIFALQQRGRWREADRLIRQLDDRILMGHVLYQRLMHPTAYRSRYRELRNWLRHYRDHPGAWAVYRLARKRGGPRAHPPRPPKFALPIPAERSTLVPSALGSQERSRSREERRHVQRFFARLKRELRRRHLEHAERYGWAMLRTGILTAPETAELFGRLTKAFFFAGQDEKAMALADIGREEAGQGHLPQKVGYDLNWYGGLAAFRAGRLETAATFFTAAESVVPPPSSVGAAAAFWAARAYWRMGRAEEAARALRLAARARESFYGLLALRVLGDPLRFDWRQPALDATSLVRLMKRKAVRRILALAEVGETHRADEEMRLLLGRSEDADWPALAALAAALKLPASQLALTRLLSDETVTAAMRYPLPDWEPEGGFVIDRALLFAFMRQESKFRARAVSRVGASGLMQVMPATASYVTGDRSLRWRRGRLYDPAFNMAVGQRYITHLLDLEPVGRSLVLLAVAYNAGPGNLLRWRRRLKTGEDPLLFVEAIPVAETRDYVERVLANLWLYRLQMGQETPSLDALAAGAWPIYEPLDRESAPALAAAADMGRTTAPLTITSQAK